MNARRALWLILPAAVLVWALTRAPLGEIAAVLKQLDAYRLAALLAVNSGILVLFGSRWRVLLGALGWRVPWLVAAVYRLAGFGVSYFTPGPQFGGEPLMIYLLRHRRGIPEVVASASVVLDRSLELMANFVFLAVGGIAVASLQVFPTWPQTVAVVLPFALLLLPVSFLVTAWQGRRPATWLLRQVPSRLRSRPRFAGLLSLVADTESQITSLCRRKPGALALAVLLGGLSWVAQTGEYWLSLRFLGLSLGLVETIAAMTAVRLAILLPVPGAAGVLEASQLLALQALGYEPAAGIGLGLLMRARDLLFAGLGLWLGSALAAEKRDSEGSPEGSSEELTLGEAGQGSADGGGDLPERD